MAGDEARLTHGDVERIVQLVEDAGFGYVHLEADGLELTLVKEGYVEPSTVTSAASAAAEPTPAEPAAAAPSAPESSTESAAAVGAASATGDDSSGSGDDDAELICSPMVGIFYRAPDPESPPYVEIGQTIEPGATIGLVEVMKMYTAIRSEVGGRVTEVLVENAEQVDRGQPLVRIEPQ